jgi:hypothetical protein
MCNLLTFSIWMRFDENIQKMNVVCMKAWTANTNDFGYNYSENLKKK